MNKFSVIKYMIKRFSRYKHIDYYLTMKVRLLGNCLLNIDMKIYNFFVWKLPQLFVILAWLAGEAYTIQVFVKGSLNMLSWVKKFPTRIYKITFNKVKRENFLEFLCSRMSSNINARMKKNHDRKKKDLIVYQLKSKDQSVKIFLKNYQFCIPNFDTYNRIESHYTNVAIN